MKIKSKTILGNLSNLRIVLRKNNLSKKYAGGDPPLRSELFSSSQMEQHGKMLAGSHTLSAGPDLE